MATEERHLALRGGRAACARVAVRCNLNNKMRKAGKALLVPEPKRPDRFLRGCSPAPRPPFGTLSQGCPIPVAEPSIALLHADGDRPRICPNLLQGLSTLEGVNAPPTLASSTNLLHITSRCLLESTVKTQKRTGPKMEPCRTSLVSSRATVSP